MKKNPTNFIGFINEYLDRPYNAKKNTEMHSAETEHLIMDRRKIGIAAMVDGAIGKP